MLGACEVNPRNLDKSFLIGHFHGATGVMVSVELGYTPRIGSQGLPGSYKFGGWFNSSKADDIGLDVDRQPRAVTGLAPLRRTGRYGVYMELQQQLTGTAVDSSKSLQTVKGLAAFFNVTQTDRRTTATDNQIAGGLFYTGLLPHRPKDDLEVAIARTKVNARPLAGLAPGSVRPNAEYAAEIDYGLHAACWLVLWPNLQYIVDPGGYSVARDVFVVGMKGAVTF